MGGRAYRFRHKEVSASDAIKPMHGNPVKIILLYGSWNTRFRSLEEECTPVAVPTIEKLRCSLLKQNSSIGKYVMYLSVRVDKDDDSLDICTKRFVDGGLEAPQELPCLLLLAHPPGGKNTKDSNGEVRIEHVEYRNLEQVLQETTAAFDWEVDMETEGISDLKRPSSIARDNLASSLEEAWSRLFDSKGNILPPQNKRHAIPTKIRVMSNEPAARIFVAGDKSQVGKSSICMALLGALLKSGKYLPSDLAYIKPATQCEAVQLVEEFCKHKGIDSCIPIGPIVYYKGFTRSFLKGETGETSEDLLQKASEAVDALAVGKKVVIIDGVGYPAVGSITGTDNASVAKACGKKFSVPGSTTVPERAPVPVVLVGKSGVGDAIDSFNINATYFSHKDVPVIGAIFNKMNLEGFYSLANCKEAIDMYFHKFQPDKRAFGYIPQIPALSNARESVANTTQDDQLKEAVKSADLFVEKFVEHVCVDEIVDAARKATFNYIQSTLSNAKIVSGSKRSMEISDQGPSKFPRLPKNTAPPGFVLSREQIEEAANNAGAAGG